MIELNISCQKSEEFHLNAHSALAPKGITVISGHSGSGKTTLLRVLAGLETQANAEVRIDGEDWQTERMYLPPEKRSVGYVFQDARLFPHLTVQENLDFASRRAAKHHEVYDADAVTEWLGIKSLLLRMPSSLSGGEARKVAVARALLCYPKLLLLDEPLNGLDAEQVEHLAPQIRHAILAADIPALYASHSQLEMALMGDHLLYLDHGKMRFDGALNAAMTAQDLPFVHRVSGWNVMSGIVKGRDAAFEMTQVKTTFGMMSVLGVSATLGESVRLVVPMNAISLSVKKPSDSTIVNTLPLRVEDVYEPANAQLTGVENIVLAAEGEKLVARITKRSRQMMAIEAGSDVYAQIKAVAIQSL